MAGRRNDDQLVAMNIHHRQALVIHRSGDYAEIHGVFNDRFQNFGAFQPADLDANIGIKLFEFGKNFRQDVETSAFIGPDNDFSPRNALHFRHGGKHGFAGLKGVLRVLLKNFARARECDLAAAAVKQTRTNFFFHGADLR